MMKFPLLLLPLVLLTVLTCGRAAEVTIAPAGPLRLWQRAEFVITGIPSAANNFDPDQIRVDAEITLPSGAKRSVPAFWTADFASTRAGGAEQLTATGTSGWRLRFMPTEAGRHEIALTLAQAGADARRVSHLEFSVADAISGGRYGWMRIAADRRSFETSDGRAFPIVGENLCWASGGGTYDYAAWFDELQRTGQNVARLWMCPWWAGIEQTPDQPTHYHMDSAWRLDRIFELAEDRGIYLILCLDFHGMLQVDNPNWGGSGNLWTRNPYHQSQGGPCLHPNEFFTSPQAQVLYQKRLRYLIGRYGASSHLFAWQFFNEIDNVYAPHLLRASDVTTWHAEMGRWLKANDPYGHLVTTSFTGGSDRPEIWSLPEMDFTVYHSYGDPAPAKFLARLADDYVARYRKPVLIGEYGVDWRGWGGRTIDPHLRAQRQALWGSALSGAAGTALSWWWEEVHTDRVYPVYAALTSILRRGGWFEGTWVRAETNPALQSAPATVGDPVEGGSAYSGPVALSNVSWLNLTDEAALTGELSAKRTSESLSGFLRGTAQGDRRRTMRIDSWWTPEAWMKLRITEVAGAAELVARIDGTEVLRKSIPCPESFRGRSAKVEVEFTLPIPAGHHRVELENVGEQWLYIDTLHAQGVREAEFPGRWDFAVEVNALRQDDRAIVYAVSPWAVYPAGTVAYRLPPQQKREVTLPDWPSGRFRVTWYDPESGAEIATETLLSSAGTLALSCPKFEVDVAAIVQREAAGDAK